MRRREVTLLPHEILFGGFLLVTWVRFALRFGVLDGAALIYLAHLLVAAGLIAWCGPAAAAGKWRVRLLFYPVAMNLLFVHMKVAIPRLTTWRADRVLQLADQGLFGGNLSLRLEPFAHPVLTEFFSLCYLLFFPYLLFSMIYYACAELTLAKRFYVGLFSVYGLGFLGYSLLPAAGPYVVMSDVFSGPLSGGWIARGNDFIVRAGSNGVDVFPSLHCAVSAYMLFFDRRHRRWRFRAYLVPCLGLWLSTIYLRYHYAVDCLAGFALAAVGLMLARRPLSSAHATSHSRVFGTGGDPA